MALLDLLRVVMDTTIMDMTTATSMVTVDMATLVTMRLLARMVRLGAPHDFLVDHHPWTMAIVDDRIIMDTMLRVAMDLAVAGDRLPDRTV